MICTTRDDGMLRTHDDASALLHYLALGATVEIRRPLAGYARESTRSYALTLERFGCQPVVTMGTYSLPCPAERLATYLRGELARASAHE